jgi:hypothetical protein
MNIVGFMFANRLIDPKAKGEIIPSGFTHYLPITCCDFELNFEHRSAD